MENPIYAFKNKIVRYLPFFDKIHPIIYVCATVALIIILIFSVIELRQLILNNMKPDWYGIQEKAVFKENVTKIPVYKEYEGQEKIGEISPNDTISFTGYYYLRNKCRIKKEELQGWVNCSLLRNLPENISDYGYEIDLEDS